MKPSNQREPETVHIRQIFIRNYTSQGDFASALDHLAEIDDLSVDWIYICPIHPIGKTKRKGTLGSPYAIRDYRAIDPALGGENAFRAFAEAVHASGRKLMLDIVFNHMSPDSVLAREHPDWFLRDAAGNLCGKCAAWSDVIDFNYTCNKVLENELIDTLHYWREMGADGFRCDVASLIPVSFWSEARKSLDDGQRPPLWLAESVHPSFLRSMRKNAYGAWSEPELHAAFDLSYDYDGWERLEKVWKDERSIDYYLDYLDIQEALYPLNAQKLRFLENHDQRRAAKRFGRGKRLRAWTLFYQFLPGATLSYMGQELALDCTPSLFERDPMDRSAGDPSFRAFYAACCRETRRAKTEAPDFSWRLLAEGLVVLERRGPNAQWVSLLNLNDDKTHINLDKPLRGFDVLSGRAVELSGPITVPPGALLIRGA